MSDISSDVIPSRFRVGCGGLSASLCVMFGTLSLLSVLAFHFPAYLTIPELRAGYDIALLRAGLAAIMAACGALGLYALMKGRIVPASVGLIALTFAALMGGADTPVGTVHASPFYIGVDWFVIGLLSTGIVFIALEKAAPLRPDQAVLRREWSLDLMHFFIMHLLLGFYLMITHAALTHGLSWARFDTVVTFIQSLPFIAQFLLIMLSVDLAEYAIHRWYHRGGFGWRIHAVHHSSETMDWLASSRLHLLEALFTRTASLAPIFLLGFDTAVVNSYAMFVGIHATFIHANVRFDFGWLEYFFVTPRHHHWHHADEAGAHNTNFAVHFSFIDRMFGTLYMPQNAWPALYGVSDGEPAPDYIAHLAYPFFPNWAGKRVKA